MDRDEIQLNDGSSPHIDLEDTKRRLHIGDNLLKLSEFFDSDTLHDLRKWAIEGRYLNLYTRLLVEWDTRMHSDNTDLINALIMSGMGAGLTPSEIAEDMT